MTGSFCDAYLRMFTFLLVPGAAIIAVMLSPVADKLGDWIVRILTGQSGGSPGR